MIFLGRGGQGGVTASNVLVQAAIYESKYGQSFPFFGAERRGAPVTAYARISDKPVLKHGMFNKANAIIVLDSSLFSLGVVKRYTIRDGGYLIVNTTMSEIPREHISSEGSVRVYTVNATKIARELGLVIAGWPLVNMAMLGSLSAATNIVSIENIEKAIIAYFGENLGRKNADAAKRAYYETKYVGEV